MNEHDENLYGVNSEENSSGTPVNENTASPSNPVEDAAAPKEPQYTSFTDVNKTDSNAANASSTNSASQQSTDTSNTYPYGNTPNTSNPYPYANGRNQTNNSTYSYTNTQNTGSTYSYNNTNAGQNTSNPYPYSNMNTSSSGGSNKEDGSDKKSSKKGKRIFASIIAVVLVVAICGCCFFFGKNSSDVSSDEETTANGIDNVDELNTENTPTKSATSTSTGTLSASEVYQKVKAASVGILVYSGSSLSSEGTGVIFTEDSDGKYTYIITCAHVINTSGASIMVQLYDETEYDAEVVGYDTVTDIGVLRVEATGLSKAEIGDSSKLVVGETIYAIGNPGGTEFANSFTDGIVSALDRPVSSSSTGYTMECIQHTAAINPGNSGGALVNEYGQVVGINSMKIVDDEYEGMGFAVPSSVFVDVVNSIIANGYVANRPKLGITYIPVSSQQTYAMYASIKGLPAGTIIVYSISEDSAFKDTDVQKGDMITAVNGKDLETSSSLSEVVESSSVGDKLTLTIVRLNVNDNYSAETFDVTVTLVENRGDTTATEEETTTSGYSGSYDDLYDYFKEYFGGDSGSGSSGSNGSNGGYGYGFGY
jgi:serine protease Do